MMKKYGKMGAKKENSNNNNNSNIPYNLMNERDKDKKMENANLQ